MGILVSLLPLIVKIGVWFLDRAAASAEQKKAFLNWVKIAGKDFSSSKLMEYADAQFDWLNKTEWKETK